MVFQRKKVASALGLVLGVGGIGTVAAPALAQDIRVDVTGSNIKRVEGEGALPVQIITREEIERTGAQTRAGAAAVRFAPTTARRNARPRTSSARRRTASQTASLRGLGGQNTLVLLNGKRLTAASGEIQGVYGVNLDSIPFSAIERVEVLKDGASAVYGSDAIAGVINFILRQDFRGAEVTAYYGAPTRSGGAATSGTQPARSASATSPRTGTTSSSPRTTTSRSRSTRTSATSPTAASISTAACIGVSGNTFPAHITTGGIGNPGFPNCAPGIYDRRSTSSGDALLVRPGGRRRREFDSRAGDRQLLRIGPLAVQPELAGLRHRPRTRRSRRATSSSRRRSRTSSPTVRTRSSTRRSCCRRRARSIRPRSRSAAGVAGQPLNVRYRAYALGQRDTTDKNEAWQTVVGVKGTAWNWDFDFDFVYSQNETQSKTERRLRALFADPAAAELRPRESCSGRHARGQAEIDATPVPRERRSSGESTGYWSKARRPATSSSCRRAALPTAVGFQVGKEELKQNFQPGAPGRRRHRLRRQHPATSTPIATTGRCSASSTFRSSRTSRSTSRSATTTTATSAARRTRSCSLRWKPIRQLLMRGSWGTGFVAPTLTQAYGAEHASALSQPGLRIRCAARRPTTRRLHHAVQRACSAATRT